MRIWIVNHYALPPGSTGGPTRHLGLSRALRDRGHDVTIIASLFDHYSRADHRPRDGRRRLVEDVDGVTYAWVPTPSYDSTRGRLINMAAFWARLQPRLKEVEPPDLVIGSSPHLLAPLAALRMANRARVPFVLEVRDLWPQSLVDLGDLTVRHPAVRFLGAVERHLYRRADQIVTVLPCAQKHFLERGASADRLHVIPNGVSVGPDPKRVPSGRFTAIYAGTMGLANGLGLVLEAGEILESRGREDISIRLVGSGPERNDLAARARGSRVVTVEAPVPAEQVPALLSSADVGLLILRDSPVFRWGISPTKLFDYMSSALPVITSVRTPSDIALEAGAGISAEPGSPGALADALEKMAAIDPRERAAMGLRGRAYVERFHSFEALAEQMETLLVDVLSSRRR